MIRRNLQPGDIIILSSFNDIIMLIDVNEPAEHEPTLWTCLLSNGSTEVWPVEWITWETREVIAA